LNGREVFRDVIHAKQQGDTLFLRDVLGEIRTFKGIFVTEMDVSRSTLILGELQ
jgi:predicted RNA-binding protein